MDHYQGTLEPGTEPTNAHIRPCNELGTHSGVDPAFTLMITLTITQKVKSGYEDIRKKEKIPLSRDFFHLINI